MRLQQQTSPPTSGARSLARPQIAYFDLNFSLCRFCALCAAKTRNFWRPAIIFVLFDVFKTEIATVTRRFLRASLCVRIDLACRVVGDQPATSRRRWSWRFRFAGPTCARPPPKTMNSRRRPTKRALLGLRIVCIRTFDQPPPPPLPPPPLDVSSKPKTRLPSGGDLDRMRLAEKARATMLDFAGYLPPRHVQQAAVSHTRKFKRARCKFRWLPLVAAALLPPASSPRRLAASPQLLPTIGDRRRPAPT